MRASKKESTQSRLERMHEEAASILAGKREEIEELNKQIDEAEKQVAQLRAELIAKTNAMELSEEKGDNEYDEEEESAEMQAARRQHEQEIQKMLHDHEEELHSLQVDYTRKLKTAEDWNKQHAETLKIDKEAQIEQLRCELDAIKAQRNEEMFANTQAKTKFNEESKNNTISNEQRIQELEQQLIDISSVAREELRDVRAKIEECLVTVELRQKEHQSECQRYENEIRERQEKYTEHIDALAEQLENEKDRLQQAAISADSKMKSLERVLKQLEKHHERQIAATQADIERMKTTITQAKAREEQTLTMTMTSTNKISTATRNYRALQQELEMIQKEAVDTAAENEELRAEIERLEKATRSKTKSRRML